VSENLIKKYQEVAQKQYKDSWRAEKAQLKKLCYREFIDAVKPLLKKPAAEAQQDLFGLVAYFESAHNNV
jgi:hypothetical protein